MQRLSSSRAISIANSLFARACRAPLLSLREESEADLHPRRYRATVEVGFRTLFKVATFFALRDLDSGRMIRVKHTAYGGQASRRAEKGTMSPQELQSTRRVETATSAPSDLSSVQGDTQRNNSPLDFLHP